ncbi:MAG: 5-formyltetrahydrofolate cyclo-ligase [Syntrophothermaceae bacterium]
MAMTWEQRKTLRQEARKNRSFLSREEVRRNSELIINSLRRLNTLNNARVVMGYLAIEKEVDIWPYLEFCLEQGQIVVLPRVEKADDRLVAVKVHWSG